jgi:tripartite-type tricarboxylate transporter receptor subunit TctC
VKALRSRGGKLGTELSRQSACSRSKGCVTHDKKDMKFGRVSWIAFLSLVAVLSPHARAQWAADTSVRIVVPIAAGGIGDVLMRLLAQEVGEKSYRTIMVENRPGGAGVIGTETVARAAPDGATLLMVASSFLINASVRRDLPYDPLTSFAPICALALSPMVFVVDRKSNYDSLSQFMMAAREPQNSLSVGASGPNTMQHLAIKALNKASHANLQFVPFTGDPPAINNLLGGHITAVLGNYAGVKAHLSSELRPLAAGSRDRLVQLPDVPTFSQAGFDGTDAVAWIGVVVPAKTPHQTAVQIADRFRSALHAPAIKNKFEALGLTQTTLCNAEFGSFMREQREWIGRMVEPSK